ncbi:glucosamine-6-phosphate deaminase [Chloroflexota bacterium]
MKNFQYDKIPVKIFETNQALGAAAAADLEKVIKERIAETGEVAIILATGNSQLSFLHALRQLEGISWNNVTIFHMDEYLGMKASHPASFRRYIHEKLVDFVHPKMFYGIEGETPNIDSELARYSSLLQEYQPVACVLGIGENGHLAFNDPPADFNTEKDIQVVNLAESARQQQVGEGHFAALEDVPKQAVTLTIPALLRPSHVLAVVPESRKAPAVKAALEGKVSPDCPASILRSQTHATLYLDQDSASCLDLRF